MKILISGGHLTPALALIDYIQANSSDQVVFVGREYSQVELKQRSQEKSEVEKRGVKFIPFHTGKWHSKSLLQFFTQFFRFIPSLFAAKKILRNEKPDVFVSFGGYLAVPVAIAAFLKGVPVITHEQTRTSGFANKVIGFFAKKVAVSFAETMELFPAKKAVLTGNPLRRQLFASHPQPDWIDAKSELPILYITGGNQGSQFINILIGQILPALAEEWCVIHQCGNPTVVMNYRRTLEKIKEKIPPLIRKNVYIREWVTESELSWIYSHAKCVVSRSGANTVLELVALAKPAIFIPLPYTHMDEQVKNAEDVSEHGGALILSQKDANPEKMLAVINQMKRRYKAFLNSAREYQKESILDADKKLFELVNEVVRK